MNIHSILRACAVDLLETEARVTVAQVVEMAYRRHGDDFAEAAQQMARAAARNIVAKLMRDLSDDDGASQLTLPGLALPSAIAVQTPDGTYYVRADKATWPELLSGRKVRVDNVTAAQSKLDAYDESLETLRPVMERNAFVSVLEALHRLRGGSEAA